MKKQTIEKPSLQELANLTEALKKDVLEELPFWGEGIVSNLEWIRRKNLPAVRTNISSLLSRVLKFASSVSDIEYELTAVERAYGSYNKSKGKE